MRRPYRKGDVINDFLLVDRAAGAKLATFKCHCGKEFEVLIRDMLAGQFNSCGCTEKHFRKPVLTEIERLAFCTAWI